MKMLFSEKLSKKTIVISIASLLVLGGGTAYGAYEAHKDTVTLSLDGESKVVRTHAGTVEDLLEDLDIKIRQEDDVSPSKTTKITNNMKIVYEASKPVQLSLNKEQQEIWTTAKTVQELIKDENIVIKEHDKINLSPETKVSKDMELAIDKAFQLTLDVGGKKKQLWTTSTTVADFLKEHNVKIDELDKVTPELAHQISENDVVTVKNIEKVTDVVEEPVAFAVVTKKDNRLEKGKQKVLAKGEKGKKEKHYEVTLENGKEIERKLLKSNDVKASKDRIVAVGTKTQQFSTINVSRGGGETGKEMYVISTAYTAYCNGCSGTTANGYNLRSNPNAKVIAVDPNVIPLGSKVYVDGYGYAVAADTGGAIKGHKIDVFFSDKSAAYRWGRKQIKIKILD
jgi:uncharacterized protein YabE (DUF348 family)